MTYDTPNFIQVFVPCCKKQFLNDRNRQTQNDNKWKKIIHYTKRKSKILDETQVVNELVGAGNFKENTFYKIPSLSAKDSVWDYYRILKDIPEDAIGVEAKSRGKPERLVRFERFQTPVKVYFD